MIGEEKYIVELDYFLLTRQVIERRFLCRSSHEVLT